LSHTGKPIAGGHTIEFIEYNNSDTKRGGDIAGKCESEKKRVASDSMPQVKNSQSHGDDVQGWKMPSIIHDDTVERRPEEAEPPCMEGPLVVVCDVSRSEPHAQKNDQDRVSKVSVLVEDQASLGEDQSCVSKVTNVIGDAIIEPSNGCGNGLSGAAGSALTTNSELPTVENRKPLVMDREPVAVSDKAQGETPEHLERWSEAARDQVLVSESPKVEDSFLAEEPPILVVGNSAEVPSGDVDVDRLEEDFLSPTSPATSRSEIQKPDKHGEGEIGSEDSNNPIESSPERKSPFLHGVVGAEERIDNSSSRSTNATVISELSEPCDEAASPATSPTGSQLANCTTSTSSSCIDGARQSGGGHPNRTARSAAPRQRQKRKKKGKETSGFSWLSGVFATRQLYSR
jgi:hypothetical protein